MSLDQIYNQLGMTSENGLYVLDKYQWKGTLPKRLELIIEKKLTPVSFFCFDRKPLVLFYDSPSNKKELFKAIWSFNESPVVIINEPDSIEIFNGFSYLKEKDSLSILDNSENLDKFSYFELVTGNSLKYYQENFKYQNRVDYCLLENIRAAREILINEHNIKSGLANALIGKCIFVRYLIDREVNIKFDEKLRKWTNKEFCNLFDNKTTLIKFFKYLKKQFNGEGFLRNEDKLQYISNEVFSVLKELLEGTELSTGQQSLFDIYDFSIIPVEFISNVYEHFIGKEDQAKKGAYYTPKFLVDYILSETVEKSLKKNPEKHNCRVLDPSCGSGIFLVEALRRIIESYIEQNKSNIKSEKFQKTLKQLAEENIFGIDKDENAVNVAVFSVYLALLDYQEPKDIRKFKFPNLIENGNFFVADFFDEEADYNKRFRKISFDFIIGNPPWGASTSDKFLKYIKNRKKREYTGKEDKPEIEISNEEIAQAFLLRTSDFSNKQTRSALIVTSKLLYNINGKKFRTYFLKNYFIDKVFELAPVRREIFDKSNDKAIAPAAILFFRYSHKENTESNELIHLCLKPNPLFSMFKIFVLQRTDIKKVVQKRLMDHDCLWKVLVYGSYLDFNLIRRLKGNYKTIEEIITNNNNMTVGQGVMIGGGDRNPASHLIGYPVINTQKDVRQFLVNTKLLHKWDLQFVHRPKMNTLFHPPVLLIKGGINNKFESVAAISYTKCVFKSSLTGIKSSPNKINTLRLLNGLFNSKLFSYNILQTGSSAGIEREESEDKEKFTFPFVDNPEISKIVKQIENICKQIYEAKQKLPIPTDELEINKAALIKQLDEEIFKSFDLDEHERTLVDYAVNITIPLIMRHKGYEQRLFSPVIYKDNSLEDYINIFIARFEKSFKEKHLKAEIWHTNNIIGIFFNVVSGRASNNRIIKWHKKNNDNLLHKLALLGVNEITKQLFIQKDIRGFEKEGFYIIKPNEKKLWHKAIGYLDVNDFADAILKAGKEAYIG